jgi:DNA-binding CsgD family transcriptional regulator/tetratricopeptide (TPR) repeat protein
MSLALAALRGARQHGSSSVVFVSGPSGIGKTALLSEICRQAVAMKFRVASSKCDPIEQVWPGAPVIAMLRGGRDPLATAAEYEDITRMVSEPLVLADRIAARLEGAAMTGALLIGIDDLQWADRVSRFALRVLISRLTGLPAVWVLASRDASPGDLGPDLAGHAGVRVEHIRLPPLSAADLVAIAQDRLGQAPDERTRRFLDAAGGNPFLATQIIDGLARSAARGEPETVPAEFTAAVARRVAALTGASRDLVDLLAVAGRPLLLRDAAALMPGTDDPGRARAAADAVDSGLISASGDVLAFRHDLVREAVYAGVPHARGRQLHRMFAEYNLTPAGDPLIAASHARAAATPGDLASARILISAAETLAPISADDAGDLAALAFHTARPAQPGWLELSLRCLSVLRRTQRAAEAIAVADQILARCDDGDVIGQVETEAARALWLSGRISELQSRAERVLKITGLNASVTAQLRAARALASTRFSAGDDAAQEAAAALECARGTGDREALALALQAAGEAAANQARHQAALRHFRELRSHTGTSWLAEEITALQFLDRYDHAQALLDQARADSRSATQATLPTLNYAQAWQDFTLGRLDDADAGARTLIELGQQLGNGMYTLDGIVIRVAVCLLRGETEAAAALLRRADGLSGADDSVRRVGLAVANGWLAAARGSIEQALRTLRPVVEGASKSRSYWPLWPCWNGLFFEFATLAGDQEFCAACVDIAEIAAARNPGVASIEGIALNVRGRSGKDLDIIAQSADVLTRSPRPVLRAFGADSYGRALLTAGQRSDGLAWLDRAWDEYHQMGAWAWRAQVQHAMREAGARKLKWSATTGKPPAGWPSLTEAERRVATLIGSGHTNKSAAAELGVSVNTIGTHLRAVFGKLGLQSRVQLANELHKEELN